jgi:iron complex transport system substrate-binding protein
MAVGRKGLRSCQLIKWGTFPACLCFSEIWHDKIVPHVFSNGLPTMASTRIPTTDSRSRSKLVLIVIMVTVFGGSFWAKALLVEPPRENPVGPGDYRRIVSMAPSITETLFALGLEDRVVGVTQYCNYPPEAQDKAKVGGFLNPNYEAILALKPDLVIMLDAEGQSRRVFDTLGLDTLELFHKDIDGILHSMETLGHTFGAEDKAERITSDIQNRLDRCQWQSNSRGLPRWST